MANAPVNDKGQKLYRYKGGVWCTLSQIRARSIKRLKEEMNTRTLSRKGTEQIGRKQRDWDELSGGANYEVDI